jgi:hypothetical protein
MTPPMHAEAELRNMLHLPRATSTAVLPLPPHCCCRSSRRRATTEYWACRAPLRSATACTTPAPCDGAVTSVVQLLCWHAHNSNCGMCCAAAAADCSSASICESYARCCAITRDHVGTYGSMDCRGRVHLHVFMLERCCNVTHHENWQRVHPAGQCRKWDGAVEKLTGGQSQQHVTCREIMNPSCSHEAVYTFISEQQALATDCELRHLWVAHLLPPLLHDGYSNRILHSTSYSSAHNYIPPSCVTRAQLNHNTLGCAMLGTLCVLSEQSLQLPPHNPIQPLRFDGAISAIHARCAATMHLLSQPDNGTMHMHQCSSTYTHAMNTNMVLHPQPHTKQRGL